MMKLDYSDKSLRKWIRLAVRDLREDYDFHPGTVEKVLASIQDCRGRLGDLPPRSRMQAMHDALKKGLIAYSVQKLPWQHPARTA